MVEKTRAKTELIPYTVDGNISSFRTVYSSSEHMVDSSTTGSARTDTDAVDRFLADPTKKSDFHLALQESARSAGDVGLSHFRVDRTDRSWSPAHANLVGNTGQKSKVTGFTLQEPSLAQFPTLVPFVPLKEADATGIGQALYDRALPNRAQADMGVTLAEIMLSPRQALMFPSSALARQLAQRRAAGRLTSLVSKGDTNDIRVVRAARDRLKEIRGLPLGDARAAADDYLAYVFGARPTVQDLDNLAESISRSRNQAETMVRSSNRRLRGREYRPEKIREASRFAVQNHFMSNVGNTWGLYDAQTHWFHQSRQRTWWSGAFRYTARDAETWLDQSADFFRHIDLLTGIGVDVRTAWDLIPFSFLADWFANTGSFLENRQIVADYNIACEYGYVMTHTRTTRDMTATGTFRRASTNPATIAFFGQSAAATSYRYRTEVKERFRCKSFGFRTDFSALNPQQWASLVALGLSNAPGNPPTIRS